VDNSGASIRASSYRDVGYGKCYISWSISANFVWADLYNTAKAVYDICANIYSSSKVSGFATEVDLGIKNGGQQILLKA
jgi:hypothetical protein